MKNNLIQNITSKIAAVIKKPVLAVTGTALVLVPVLSFMSAKPSEAQTTKWCWCTEYVVRRAGLSWSYPHAKDFNDGYLQRQGYRQVSSPQIGSIVVMETSFPGANTSFGHVGFVHNVNWSTGQIQVRGGAQSFGPYYSDAGCYNVSNVWFGRSVYGRGDVTFWVR